MKKMKERVMAFLLAFLVMFTTVISDSSFVAKAAETGSWTEVAFSDITGEDTVAITMTTSAGTVYALPNVATSSAPSAKVTSIVEDTLSSELAPEDYGWTIEKNEDGTFAVKNGENFLYVIANNNGVRVGKTEMALSIDAESGYIKGKDSKETDRFLGIYETAPDWRCYTNTTGNTKNQTLRFFKYTEGTSSELEECAEVTASVNGQTVSGGNVAYGTKVALSTTTEGATIMYSFDGKNFNVYTAPIEITKAVNLEVYAEKEGMERGHKNTFAFTIAPAAKVTNLTEGAQIVIYNAGKEVLLSATANGKKLAGAEVSVGDGVLETVGTAAALTVEIVTIEDVNYYRFKLADNQYLTSGATGNSISFAAIPAEGTDYSLWRLDSVKNAEGTETGDFYIVNKNASFTKNDTTYEEAIEYYGGFTTYNYTKLSAVYEMSFYDADLVVETCAAPVATVADKSVVDAGSKVGFTSATSGAKIYYSRDNGATYSEYKDELVINESVTYMVYASKDGIRDSKVASFTYSVKEAESEEPGETEETEEPETPAVTEATLVEGSLLNGDRVVLYHPTSKTALTTTVNGKKLDGTEVVVADGKLTLSEASVQFDVVASGEYFYLVNDGKYLTSGATGSTLTMEEKANDYSLWYTEETEGGMYVINANAKYGTSPQYLEYYKGYTMYSYKEASNNAYVFQFYRTKKGVEQLKYDEKINVTVARWAGNANYDEAKITNKITGDLFDTNDLLDLESTYTAVVAGKTSKLYTSSSSSTGSTTYYMGGTGLGSTKEDYMLFETSSKGIANMTMSFRLRASNTGTGAFQLQYSTDGKTFENFTTGSYACKYTQYASDGSSSDVSLSGDLTDGIAKTTYAPTKYIEFKFDVPAAASNADKLYIRLLADNTVNAKGETKAPSSTSVVRIDSVVISGNPVTGSKVCGFVNSSVESGEVALGTELTLTTKTSDAKIYYSVNGGDFEEYKEAVKLTSLPVNIRAYAVSETLGKSVVRSFSYTQAKCAAVKATPNGGAVTLNSKLTLKTATEGATILYAFVSEGDAELEWKEYSTPVALTNLPVSVKVKAVKDGYEDSAISTLSFTEKTNEKYGIFFGQIHAHTNYSDGAGSVEEAFAYATKVKNLDYLAVTDHSNSLDNAADSVISKNVDKADTDEWTKGHSLAAEYSSDDFTCIYGYEMTWSNGLGHMNTFNTPGFQSRTQTAYSTYSTALNNYYTALETVPDSVSMFNHPGTTFGDFQDFSYYTEARDALITMIEVGNGEGTIGSSGYFPSYEYYTRALDKGWHVSPTNNQDNHKGKWGDANTARTVALADSNDEASIYDAMRNNRLYATEDNNLSIYYTLDSFIMGTVLEQDQVGDKVEIKAEISDADKEAIGKVEVIVNGGLSIASKDVTSNEETVTFEVPSTYSYYYLRITEKDGDIAVTSPVWVGEVEACGINSTYTNAAIAVQDEAYDVHVDLYNNENEELIVNEINVVLTDVDGKEYPVANITGEEAHKYNVASNSTKTIDLSYTYAGCGAVTYQVTVNASLNGVEKVYSDKLAASYVTTEMVTEVIIDGTHYNDYVAGYYGGNVTNFINICGDKNIRATVVKDEITKEMLESCALLVISAPAKKTGTANAGDFTVSHFEDSFIEMVAEYVAKGGNVILCGMADYQDTTNGQTATEMNKLLSAIGSNMRINSDEVYDEVNNGGQAYRLYPSNFNTDSKFLNGIVNGQTYSQYSGCSINIDGAKETDTVYAAEALVSGFDTTYSIDCKNDDGSTGDSKTYVEKGHVTFLGHEETKAGGNIFAAGGVFVSDFEVKAELDNADSLPYANYTIVNNILDDVKVVLPTTSIAEVRKAEMNSVFAIEGYVTSGTDNEYNKFFDTIYVQDDTAGIDIFPYSEAGLAIGTKVRIVGFVAAYQGDKELKVISCEILKDEAKHVYDAKLVSTKDAMDYDALGGSLLKTMGQVTRVEYNADGTVAEFWLKDQTGAEAAIFIDGYIFSGTTGKNELASFVKAGATVGATGVLYMHPEGDSDESVPVFRVRNCDDIYLITAAEEDEKPSNPGDDKPSNPGYDDNNSNELVIPGTDLKVEVSSDLVNGELELIIDASMISAEYIDTAIEAVLDLTASIEGKFVQVTVSGETAISSTTFETAKKAGLSLVLVDKTSGVKWNFAFDKNDSIDSAFKFIAGTKLDEANAECAKAIKALGKDLETVSFDYSGTLPGQVTVTIPVSEAFADGTTLYFYYYNPATKLYELADASVVSNRQITVKVAHCSDYVLVSEQLPKALVEKTKANEETVASEDAVAGIKTEQNINTVATSDKPAVATGDETKTYALLLALIAGMGLVFMTLRKKVK